VALGLNLHATPGPADFYPGFGLEKLGRRSDSQTMMDLLKKSKEQPSSARK
jgi:hypothetical protein